MSDGRGERARLEEALRTELSALLGDRDVSAVRAFASGGLEVTRRGRKERLEAGLAPSLFELFASALGPGDGAVLSLSLDGHRVQAGRLTAGDVTLYVEKAPSLDVTLADLEEEGLLPPGLSGELVALALEGHGLFAVGPARAGRDRLVAALAHEIASALVVVDLHGRSAEWLTPVPPLVGSLPERAALARAFGADALLALSLSLDDTAALNASSLETSLLASVACASLGRLEAALGGDSLPGQLCVVGKGPDGRARLVEHHAPRASAPRPLGPAAPPAPVAIPPVSVTPPASTVAPAFESSVAPPMDALPPLEPLAPGPPTGWASSAPDDDPGWELGDGPARPSTDAPVTPSRGEGAFDRVLSEVKGRPTFTPKAPPPHPQERLLRGDPFGGLTFEPPGGAADDDGEGQGETPAPGKKRPR